VFVAANGRGSRGPGRGKRGLDPRDQEARLSDAFKLTAEIYSGETCVSCLRRET